MKKTSHPLRVRELKPICRASRKLSNESHPLRVRELKLQIIGIMLLTHVAPFTGA